MISVSRLFLRRFDDIDLESATLVFFDLNGFKRINDEHGHQVGDTCLMRFASALTYCPNRCAQNFTNASGSADPCFFSCHNRPALLRFTRHTQSIDFDHESYSAR